MSDRETLPCAVIADIDSVFFPDSGPHVYDTARLLCASCPVRPACLAYAMSWESQGKRYGFVGGLTPKERSELYRQGRRSAA